MLILTEWHNIRTIIQLANSNLASFMNGTAPITKVSAGMDISTATETLFHSTPKIKEDIMYNIYLKDEDLLRSEHFPVAALLNEASNSNIVEFVENLSKRVGSGYNFSDCSFWNDLDEYEQTNTPKFDGLWVTNEADEDIIISLQDLKYYLEVLYRRLTDAHFADLPRLRQALDKFEV